jgi:hypothetical protein
MKQNPWVFVLLAVLMLAMGVVGFMGGMRSAGNPCLRQCSKMSAKCLDRIKVKTSSNAGIIMVSEEQRAALGQGCIDQGSQCLEVCGGSDE